MADYVAKYIFHIDERKRPENFPKIVYIIDTYSNVENEQHMAQIYNNRFKQLATAPGVVVHLDQNIDASNLTFDKRKYVPWHMIAYAEGEVKVIIPQEPPIPLDDLTIPPPEPPPSNKKETVQ